MVLSLLWSLLAGDQVSGGGRPMVGAYAPRRRGPRKKKTSRICLKCDQPFPSSGSFNRLCPNCRDQNQEISAALAEGVNVDRAPSSFGGGYPVPMEKQILKEALKKRNGETARELVPRRDGDSEPNEVRTRKRGVAS